MYKIRENNISLSSTIHSLTSIFASISGRLPMLTTLGQITPVCIRTFSLSDKFNYFAAVISRYADSTSPTFSASINLQKVHYAVLLSRTPFGGMWPHITVVFGYVTSGAFRVSRQADQDP